MTRFIVRAFPLVSATGVAADPLKRQSMILESRQQRRRRKDNLCATVYKIAAPRMIAIERSASLMQNARSEFL
ncbi:hypothetical protein [Antarcticimicrobium luteum]|uniref:Uncharacterized protein n=1 Tax=Antarcticimicrobium luteum TaxID=2547397 RepID=A0A4R5VH00_9RHOB|nr:hypothetical protein [Antarcticimicrobium luteum]TDK51272.1 hypothetical protein E1832_03855 [Antarcticimicrobium luteum]